MSRTPGVLESQPGTLRRLSHHGSGPFTHVPLEEGTVLLALNPGVPGSWDPSREKPPPSAPSQRLDSNSSGAGQASHRTRLTQRCNVTDVHVLTHTQLKGQFGEPATPSEQTRPEVGRRPLLQVELSQLGWADGQEPSQSVHYQIVLIASVYEPYAGGPGPHTLDGSQRWWGDEWPCSPQYFTAHDPLSHTFIRLCSSRQALLLAIFFRFINEGTDYKHNSRYHLSRACLCARPYASLLSQPQSYC